MKITKKDLCGKTDMELSKIGGSVNCSDSYGRELWEFEIDGKTFFAQKEDGINFGAESWTSDPDVLEGWFPDDDRSDWELLTGWLE